MGVYRLTGGILYRVVEAENVENMPNGVGAGYVSDGSVDLLHQIFRASPSRELYLSSFFKFAYLHNGTGEHRLPIALMSDPPQETSTATPESSSSRAFLVSLSRE